MSGFADGTIRPGESMTRAHVATIFFRLMSDEDRSHYWSQENDFTDVSINQWFNNAISTTANAGLFTGFPDGSFQPDRPVTRAEMAVMVVRWMGITPIDDLTFNDTSTHWAQRYINAAANEGWITGPEGLGGPFMPNQTITRAQAAAIIVRMLGLSTYAPDGLLPNMNTWSDNENENTWYYRYIQIASNSYYVIWEDGREVWVRVTTEERPWYRLEQPTSRPEDIFN